MLLLKKRKKIIEKKLSNFIYVQSVKILNIYFLEVKWVSCFVLN